MRAEHADAVKELGDLSAACAVSKERKSGIESTIANLRQEAEDMCRRDNKNREESAAVSERIGELEIAGRGIEDRIAEYGRALAGAEAEFEEKQKLLAEMRSALASSEENLKRFSAGREDVMKTLGDITIEKTRLESDLDHLERNCMNDFDGRRVAELVPDIPEEDWARNYEDAARDYENLREKLQKFGGVNQNALEEYQEKEQEYQFKNSQRIDIEQSIANIQASIAEINQRCIEQFSEAYAAIRQNIQEVFQALFGGGHCDIRLLDENDVSESGIDITAQPPGKKLQSVSLLSGGEKALTALALLIAIFRYRPSPVCILDEVDAPLDEANVGRFARMLTEMSGNTQFIIITHNKSTMEAVDSFFGVAMEEPGVSKVVSVDFRRYKQAS